MFHLLQSLNFPFCLPAVVVSVLYIVQHARQNASPRTRKIIFKIFCFWY
uniref:Uncharacterized protein n=1 Tax=Salmonella phage vB_SEnST11_KE22 TaxID=3161173 RepID=A0AAU8GEF8_9CAUD